MTKETYVDLVNYLDSRIEFNEMTTDARICYNDIVAILEDDNTNDNLNDEQINDFVRTFIDDEEII